MRSLEHLTAKQILSIASPERLFSSSIPQSRQEYRTLVHRWHPDICQESQAPLVLAHLHDLYTAAQERLREGTWIEPPERIDQEKFGIRKYRNAKDSSVTEYHYRGSRPFELGHMYTADNFVLFEVRRDCTDLVENALELLNNLPFHDRDMAAEMSQYLPQVLEAYDAIEAHVVVVRKTPDQILLADLLEVAGGCLEAPEHAGWILNSMLNIACYLSWAGLVHNAISTESVFISPLRHNSMLLGGWWYARPTGQNLLALPEKLLDYVPPDTIRNQIADTRTDLRLIKALGLHLFGHQFINTLSLDSGVPEPILRWLQSPSTGDAGADYAEWKYTVLPDCFGAPRFVELNVSLEEVYKEK